ncbi:MAG: glucose-6-phosphate isomerase, partial [Thaumarchaeota archaeon]|nr:glucose-6-phosphate isomerase [Nitrososphaerota archaeon]
SLNELKNLQSDIATTNLDVNNPALNIANWINGIALIYYPWGLNAAAIRFKNSLQENAKTHALVEDVIEACHNGIVSWERPSIIQPILLEGKDDYIKTKERWKILKEYFVDNKIDYKEVFTVNGSILSKLINLIYLLDYASIYCAILSNVDPSPVNSIDFIKSKL